MTVAEQVSAKTRLREFFRLKISLWGILTVGALWAGAGTVAGFLGPLAWWLDLFSHFRVQYALFFAFLALCCAVAKRWKAALAALAICPINVAVFAPLFIPYRDNPTPSGPAYRAMMMNVNVSAGNPEWVAKRIEEESPDILLLEEVSDRWIEELDAATAKYPYRTIQTRGDPFGIALYSRYPWKKSEIVYLGEARLPSVYAEIELGAGTVTVVGTHPVCPANGKASALRNDQLAKIPEFLRRFNGPVVLLGDLNTTPWSYHFQSLLRDAGLKDSSRGRGIQPTWPTHRWPLLIPIDHFLYRGGIAVVSKRIGRKTGSDHYPVIVEFAISRERE